MNRYVLGVLSIIVTLSGCSRSKSERPKLDPPDPLWSSFVSAHTSGLVSRKAHIRVEFTQDVVPPEQIGASARAALEIDPGVRGASTFSSPREIVFVPEGDLEMGRYYRVSLRPEALEDVPDSLGSYEFVFQVIEQELEVELEGLTAGENDDAMTLKGALLTADVSEADRAEQVIEARYLDEPLPVTWRHSTDGKRHDFEVSGIARQASATPLTVSWNGASIDVDNTGASDVEIPARDQFKVTRVQTFQDQQARILVFFSDNLDAAQNLSGLVRLDQTGHTTRIEGNILSLYPDQYVSGNVVLTLEPGIRNAGGERLEESSTHNLAFSSRKPQVRFVGKGVILPDNPVLSIPFEAVSVREVTVTALRIFGDNVGQFLQTNTLDGGRELGRVGRYLWRRTIPLSSPEPNKWNRYSLDATELFTESPGGIYRLTLSIRRADSTYTCPENTPPASLVEPPLLSADDLDHRSASSWDYYEDYYGVTDDGSQWSDRDDPCKDAYYRYANGTTDGRNFLSSNIGLLAKRDQHGKFVVVATDLRSSEPLRAAKLSVMSFQDQLLLTATTDANGFAEIESETKPFYLIAEKDGDRGYLKLSDGTALPVSHFDVGGEKIASGIKGHIYGERGVWRPGDDVHLTFVLEDEAGTIPEAHPVTMELYNPRGQLIESRTNASPVGEFYTFTLGTDEDAPTGRWRAHARLGGNVFTTPVRIETVMPNRLKVELDFGKKVLRKADMPIRGTLFGQWLSGAKASKLDAKIEARLAPIRTRFDRNADFVFDDPAREFTSEPQTIFEGALDGEGRANVSSELHLEGHSPGMLRASFSSRIFEPGGAFSISQTSLPFSPYEAFVGIKLPKGDATRNMLLTDVDHTVEIASLDAEGNPVSMKDIDITIYKIGWKWWWDGSGESLAQFASAEHQSVVDSRQASTTDGSGTWMFQIKYPAWGRYLLRACDSQGGHCAGQVFYIDWPGWAGRAMEQSGPGANALAFVPDKKQYDVGETARIQLPEASDGRALVTIENGTGLLERRWMELSGESPAIEIPVTKAMSPNAYVSVTLLQPHSGKKNDRPIRLYGITPLIVNDPETLLEPRIEAPVEWAPETTATIAVSEARGRPMTYTVAVVDEGLLGLTNFETPNLHDAFYKKEALGVMTWDLFDDVVGAYGGELERLLALGGDMASDIRNEDRERRRFPPVVTFLGPFELARGKKNDHRFDLPQYVGSVRVMVVAGKDGAYGSGEKSVFVRKPLMLLPTLPRVVSPDEELSVPVSLFVMDPSIRDVRLEVHPDAHFEVDGASFTNVAFSEPDEKLGFVRLRARSDLGMSTIRFSASGGGHRAEAEVNLEIRSPNPPSTRTERKLLEAGESFEINLTPHGLPGTNSAKLEIASMPPLDLERHLHYLVRYPHGCLEQTVSAVFPQLFLTTLLKLEPERAKDIDVNIEAGIRRLRGFQVPTGGFVYWPGGFWGENGADARSSWSTSYVGHFLVEADRLGHHVPAEMLSDWIRFQKSAAQSWTDERQSSTLDQAYRLYTLALAGQPELGAMNRLRERTGLSSVARWQLASAYALSGLMDAANDIVRGDRGFVPEDVQPNGTFASGLRDRAMILGAMIALKRDAESKDFVDLVSADLSSGRWHSTHALSFGLLAMAKFAGSVDSTLPTFEYTEGTSGPHAVTMSSPIYTTDLDAIAESGGPVVIENTSSRRLFASLFVTGTPRAGEEDAISSGLSVDVRYTNASGDPVDVGRLGQGEDFVAHLSVRNGTGAKIENIALSEVMPSGWEIHNTRLVDPEARAESSLDYEDIRDDRVYRYFGLNAGESKTFTTRLTAAYLGRFYLPGVLVEAMYDASKNARTKGQWVLVAER
ncbi:MAG TPA: MG2 domain-containing protein [Vicinamibacteria bacterium]|nr:MG2 domain-containing protein [Vicinamibacteria bacterium]